MYLLHNAQLLHDGEESMFRPIMLVFKLLSFSCLTHTLFKKSLCKYNKQHVTNAIWSQNHRKLLTHRFQPKKYMQTVSWLDLLMSS